MEHSALSTMIRHSSWAVMALESVHLIGLALLLGAAILLAAAAGWREGLRPGLPLAGLERQLRPLMLGGLALLVISGTLIALSMPFKYYNNGAFRWKMLWLGMASLVLVFLYRRVYAAALRLLAALSLLLWLGVAFCGRLIGFL